MIREFVRRRNFLILSLLTLSPLSVSAQSEFKQSQAVDEAVIAAMREQNIVGAAVGIIRNSKVVYAKGYGFANLRSNTPVTDDTVFNWASNSKPVIAVAALQLVQDQKLDLDQPNGTYVPRLPDHLKNITTRQLLCHQSGIPHYSNGRIVPSDKKMSSRQELEPLNCLHRFVMSPLIFPPGTKTDYSSYAYILLSAVVQEAGKKPLAQQLSARIIKPLDLKSFQLDLQRRQRNWVTAYKIRNGQAEEVADAAHFWKHGAGAYKSSIKDFAKFAAALANQDLIDESTTTLMWTRQPTNDGTVTSWGLGISVSGEGNSLKISHNGSQDETRTRMVAYPNQKHGVVVMCNTQDCDPGRISTAVYTAINAK